ncbi:uncharacterized protein JCM10292_001444 [Rhodotorula paludigena]|uniref:uncharacterized protein n=1 Tax=Rhodotorula paludigena TaxID=86838 RepID=UPI003170D2B7
MATAASPTPYPPASPSAPRAVPTSAAHSSSASTAAFLPTLLAAASMNAFSSGSPTSASAESRHHPPALASTSSSSFFTSNRNLAPAPAPAPAQQHARAGVAPTQSFLPPLQPAPAASTSSASSSRPNGRLSQSHGGGGATLLSDEETSPSDAGGVGSVSGGGQGGYAPSSYGSSLPAIAPAPASGTGRSKARSGSVASSTGGGTKGKGKARLADNGDVSSGGSPAPGGGGGKKKGGTGKGGKRAQQMGPDGKPVPKKKKAGRACAACQKAHLTCDDSRPCARCIKKGCPDECVDGARKKAKYLQEIPDELLERGRQNGTPATGAPPTSSAPPPSDTDTSFFGSALDLTEAGPSSTAQPQPFFDFSATLATSTPSASAAPLASSSTAGAASSGMAGATGAAAYDPSSFLSFPSALNTPTMSGPGLTLGPANPLADSTQFGSEAAGFEYAILNAMLNGNGFALDTHTTPTLVGAPPGVLGGAGAGEAGTGLGQLDSQQAGGFGGSNDDPMLLDGGAGGPSEHSPYANGASPAAAAAATGGQAGGQQQQQPPQQQQGGLLTAEEAYRSVTKPYPYAQSYHYLVKHLKDRFEKNDILRIIRALATFRPSLIALQMPLTEEDETFVERTFQRTLVELNKLISFSGTPTVVWRRTGEICLVGTEFCLLTGWKREELVGKKYIFELFDTASVVEYYESFAKHAFESTATSITMQCVVLGPDGRPVPCAFCFSVRRDLFSCPFLVIGSFLPVLV